MNDEIVGAILGTVDLEYFNRRFIGPARVGAGGHAGVRNFRGFPGAVRRREGDRGRRVGNRIHCPKNSENAATSADVAGRLKAQADVMKGFVDELNRLVGAKRL